MRGANIPQLEDLLNYDVNRRGEYEGIRQSFYDFTTYDAAGQTELQFFQTPKGQGGKSIEDTNMTSAGQLPQPQHFLVESIEIYLFPGDSPVNITVGALAPSNFSNDMYAVAQQGALDFFIGSKSYLIEAPLNRFPPKTKMEANYAVDTQQAAAAAEQYTSDYAAWVGRPYYLDPPVLLVPNQNFAVTLAWRTAVALPSGTDARIGVVLDGLLYRQSQ